MEKGKFLVFEGLDGSGKSTQTKLLFNYLKEQGREVVKIDFPQHGEKSAGLVDNYLTGKYGKANEVNPYIASIFYACDRYDASFKMKQQLSEGKIIIADRYIASNIGHQGGKIENKEERQKYIAWLYNLEYSIFKIPKPDVTFILKTTPAISKGLSNNITDEEKAQKRRAYLGDDTKQDVHEEDTAHLADALRGFLQAKEDFPGDFEVIECLENEKLLAPEIIQQKILNILKQKHIC